MQLKKPIKSLYVEDVADDRRALEDVLSGFDAFLHVKSFDNATDCFRYLQDYEADMLFLDIEMPGKNGLWLANKVKHLPIPIVFVTSHTGYAIQAFEVCALDYIIKPVQPEDITDMLERLSVRLARAEHLMYQEQIAEVVDHYLSPGSVPTRLFINFVGETQVAELKDVLYLKASDRYTHIHMADGTRHVSSKAFKSYVDTIESHPDFVRIHRSTLINRKHIRALQKDSRANKYGFKMSNGEVLEISRRKRSEIIEAAMS